MMSREEKKAYDVEKAKFHAEREKENKSALTVAREALTKLQPGARITVMTQEAAARISQVTQILPQFPGVMLAETADGRRVYMCNQGKGTYILFLKTKLSDTGRPFRQWVKSQLKAVDIVLYGFPDSTVFENYLEAPQKGIYRM